MHVWIDSLILKTLNSVMDIELTYRVTGNLFKLENNQNRHFKFIEVVFSLPRRFSINPYFYFFSFMHVWIDSLILKTLNSEMDIELRYPVTGNLFKLVKQSESSFQIHWSCVFTSWKIFYQPLFLFLFLHACLNRFIDFKDFK
jgi:hypothetical protein